MLGTFTKRYMYGTNANNICGDYIERLFYA